MGEASVFILATLEAFRVQFLWVEKAGLLLPNLVAMEFLALTSMCIVLWLLHASRSCVLSPSLQSCSDNYIPTEPPGHYLQNNTWLYLQQEYLSCARHYAEQLGYKREGDAGRSLRGSQSSSQKVQLLLHQLPARDCCCPHSVPCPPITCFQE